MIHKEIICLHVYVHTHTKIYSQEMTTVKKKYRVGFSSRDDFVMADTKKKYSPGQCDSVD